MKHVRPAVIFLLLMIFIFGILHTTLVWIGSHVFFPAQAEGSLVHYNGTIIGSRLVGQNFSHPGYFWPRPSSTENGYLVSAARNLNPSNPRLLAEVKMRLDLIQDKGGPMTNAPIPADYALASASGLDPHISPLAAKYQVERIARTRNMEPNRLHALIDSLTEPKSFGLFGEDRVNVLLLNIRLNLLSGSSP